MDLGIKHIMKGPHSISPEPADAVIAPERPTIEEAIKQYERVVARLLYAGEEDSYLLAVTSAFSGEGVTTVAAGIALALAANTPKRVVIVDANLRQPALDQVMSVSAEPGLHELVAAYRHPRRQGSDESQAYGIGAHPTSLSNLWVIPAGSRTSNPAQVLTSDAAKAQLELLRSRFGYIILDCPPALSSAEAATLCRIADGTALVVRAGITPREDVKRAQEVLQGAPVLGVILNGV